MGAILIIDDETAIATLLGEVVKKLGYEPVVVQRAEDFIPAFRQHKPALAIIDYMIPGVDGGQLFEAMRAMTAGAGLPVIFITAIPLGQVKQRVPERAGVRFMQKPLDFAEMRRNIEELLAERGIKPAAPRAPKRPG